MTLDLEEITQVCKVGKMGYQCKANCKSLHRNIIPDEQHISTRRLLIYHFVILGVRGPETTHAVVKVESLELRDSLGETNHEVLGKVAAIHNESTERPILGQLL